MCFNLLTKSPRPNRHYAQKEKVFCPNLVGEKWLEVLDELGSYWPNRLPRGRRYARSGAVVSLDLFPAQIAAKVQGTRATPYRVSIKVRPFSPEEKERFLAVLKRRPLLAASLLQLKVPAEILETLEEEGLELLPTRPEEFETKCSCPDWANPCKHIAAVFYVITEAIDRDPFNLFLLRGITKKEILASLELKREKRRAVRHFTPKEEDLTRFHSLRGKESRSVPIPPFTPNTARAGSKIPANSCASWSCSRRSGQERKRSSSSPSSKAWERS